MITKAGGVALDHAHGRSPTAYSVSYSRADLERAKYSILIYRESARQRPDRGTVLFVLKGQTDRIYDPDKSIQSSAEDKSSEAANYANPSTQLPLAR